MKRTPDDHPDYVNLKLATEQMVKAGASVNEKKREQEECEKKERQDELGKKNLGEMVFCFQNCSDLLWKKIVLTFEIRGNRMLFELALGGFSDLI